MTSKVLVTLAIFAVILGGAGIAIMTGKLSGEAILTILKIQKGTRYSLEEVSLHNTENDCWLIYNKKVYDVTMLVNSFKEAEVLKEKCGQAVNRASIPSYIRKTLGNYRIGNI